jgi:hypothetical protein
LASSVRSELISEAAQTLSRLARLVSKEGDSDFAERLYRQAADLELSSPALQLCWGGPFNGQIGRQALMADLLQLLQPSAVIETGTYRGISTEWIARNYSGRIYTVEKERLYYLQAEARLRSFPNVQMNLEDSREGLRHALSILRPDETVLIYLDAHWEKDLPLREELAIIFQSAHRAAVVIDDFRVPDDSGYHWDDYGPGKVFDIGLLAEELPPKTVVYFPSLAAKEETGARRGCCVIATNGESRVGNSALLRGAEISDWVRIQSNDRNSAKNG